MESYEFDLYDEVKKNYKKLLPKKEETLAIFILYQKIALNILEPTFSHDNVIEAIDQAYEDQGKTNRKKSPIRDNEIIHNLMPFFLKRQSKGYALKGFANDFCKLIENELLTRFNPSQIEIQFNIFYQALKENLATEEKFSTWYEVTFDKNKNVIKKQLEILHTSVESTINELNLLYNSADVDFADKLRAMDSRVKGLSVDTKKLESAFQLVDDILTLINQAYNDQASFAYTSERFREIRKEIKAFFEEIADGLAEVSFSVDKIKPQLERLYGSFEQRELDRKLEKFVEYLFKHAIVQKVQNKEDINLPNLALHNLTGSKSRFLYPFYYNFANQASPPLRVVSYNVENHRKQYLETKNQIAINRKSVVHFKAILAKIRSGARIDYHDYFFDLLDKENSLEVALKTTHLLLRELLKTPNSIEISTQFTFSANNKNIAIWRTRLQNSNS